MEHLPIIKNPSGDSSLPKKVIDGLINTAIINAAQHRYIDGLITHADKGMGKSSLEPIRAEGSYVGAPTMPASKSKPVFAPKTKTPAGMIMPVGQN
jgi:hypothetical protein